ncbi:MAG: peptide ABC transporter substrate-binding protein [Anaerolineae bacterium]
MGRYIRWQLAIAAVGVISLTLLLAYSAYSVTNVLVPDRGGTFREGVAGTAQYINPLLCQYNEVDQDLCALVFRGLMRLDERGRAVPDLAAEPPMISDDGLTYTFRLKEGLQWQDGAPITADDVVFTVQLMQDPEFPGVPFLGELWRTVDVQKLDDLTVQFTLEQPYTPFIDYTAIGLLPKHLWEGVPVASMMQSQLNLHPVGNGPFQVTEVSATSVRLEPNPRYEGPVPYLGAVEFHFYNDLPSVMEAFIRGEIDSVSRILPQDMARAENREDLQIFSSPLSGFAIVLFNLQNPNAPFLQDKAVRQALMYALDRQRLIDEILAGQAVVAHSTLLPTHWAYDPDVPRYQYDPEQARRLLDEAGYVDTDGDGVREKDGRPLRFILLSDDEPTHEALIQRIAAAWKEIGVDAAPQAVSFTGLVSDFIFPHEFDAALLSWELSGDPDPYPLWHSSQARNGGQNYGGWSDPAVDEWLERGRAILDEGERRTLYNQFQERFAEELPGLLLYYPVYTYGVHTRVHDVEVGPLNVPSDRFRTIAQWYIVTRRITLAEARSMRAAHSTPQR